MDETDPITLHFKLEPHHDPFNFHHDKYVSPGLLGCKIYGSTLTHSLPHPPCLIN